MATGGLNLSKEFFELLKAIGESKSKQEEDRIISKEVSKLKYKIETGTVGGPHGGGGGAVGGVAPNPLMNSKKRAKEFLVRLLYVEMLGHDGSFGYIKAVEMTASASLYHKRTGYVVCAACLPPEHEFRFMLVNQMQRDLQSPNVLEAAGGLLACTSIITADMVPAVAGEVSKLLTHESATIRKKSIICMHRFYQLAPEVVSRQELQEQLRKHLCDKDPSVMGSSLNVIEALSNSDPTPFKDLVPSLVSILKQIGDHRLPSDYDYHRVPAPWMQLKLVRILSYLGRSDAAAASGMYEILSETMKKADTGTNAGYAIIYECVKTIVSIYPNSALVDAAAAAISRFVDSPSHNLKYLGVTGLAMIVESHPQYAAQHQLAVLDCLEDPDETLQRKTLDLLYRMTNPVNVEFITEKLVDFISKTTDLFLKQLLTKRVCSLAERFAPDNSWYIRTITRLFEESGDMVPHDVAQNLMSLIAEGTGESEENDVALRQNAVEIYVNLLHDKPVGSLPRILLETMAWCLGEYGYLSNVSSLDHVLDQLCYLTRSHKAKLATSTRKFLLSAIMKLVAQAGTCPPLAASVIDDFTKSVDMDLQQRCLEFQKILTNCPQLLPEILPVDASAEDVEVDVNLSFLDNYVRESLSQGARPYEKPEDDDDDDDDGDGDYSGRPVSAFNMKPYDKPLPPSQAMMAMSGMGSAGRTSTEAGMSLPPGVAPSAASTASAGPAPAMNLSLNTRNVANVWGPGGVKTAAAPTPPPAPAPSAPAASQAAWDQVSTSGVSVSSAGGSAYGYGAGGVGAPAEPVAMTAQQQERMAAAAALFGGVVPGSAPPPPPPPVSAPAATVAPPVSAPPVSAPVAAPPIAAAPAPPSAPAPEVDLLDMSMWDNPAAASASAAPNVFDQFDAAPTPLASTPAPASASGAGPVVETVSDDEMVAVAPAPALVDPFAGAGLLSDVSDAPLASLAPSQKFEYDGATMVPMRITTAQFGQKWGSSPATVPVSTSSSKVNSLTKFMELCDTVGMHNVEAIPTTNEGICAGMLNGGSQFVLVHGKVTPTGGATKIDATIKSTDSTLAGTLAMYLQTMLR